MEKLTIGREITFRQSINQSINQSMYCYMQYIEGSKAGLVIHKKINKKIEWAF